jgi:hypothetical protein
VQNKAHFLVKIKSNQAYRYSTELLDCGGFAQILILTQGVMFYWIYHAPFITAIENMD